MERISTLLLAATALAVPACSNDVMPAGGAGGSGSGSGSNEPDEWAQLLASRTVDYGAALKIASLRLAGDIPTIAEIAQIANAAGDREKKTVYEALVRGYLSRPTFATQMFYFWRDTFKMGGTPALDAAPAFAAQLTVGNGDFRELFTRSSNGCPTFNETTGAFSNAECTNGGLKAGILTNPGVNAQFTSNLAFRRVRWVQETFDCLRFPAEISDTPIDVGGAQLYAGVWPFDSVASPTNGGGRIDFHDVSAAMCMDCHSTMNHIAPLFGNYDAQGVFETTIAVATPLDGAPLAKATDWLPPGEPTAWRFGKPAADLPALGAAMAADADVAKCGVARMWNFAFGNSDIVDSRREVPIETVQAQLDAFTQGGYRMKDLVFAIFTSDDFIRF